MNINRHSSRPFHALAAGILVLALTALPLKVDLQTGSVELASTHAGKGGGGGGGGGGDKGDKGDKGSKGGKSAKGGKGGKGFGQAKGKFGTAKIAKSLTLTSFKHDGREIDLTSLDLENLMSIAVRD